VLTRVVAGPLLAAVVLIGAESAVSREVPLRLDDPAPDFALVDQHGKLFRLSETLASRDFVVLAFCVTAFTGG